MGCDFTSRIEIAGVQQKTIDSSTAKSVLYRRVWSAKTKGSPQGGKGGGTIAATGSVITHFPLDRCESESHSTQRSSRMQCVQKQFHDGILIQNGDRSLNWFHNQDLKCVLQIPPCHQHPFIIKIVGICVDRDGNHSF